MAACQGGRLVVHFTNRKNAPLLFFHMTGDATESGKQEHHEADDLGCETDNFQTWSSDHAHQRGLTPTLTGRGELGRPAMRPRMSRRTPPTANRREC